MPSHTKLHTYWSTFYARFNTCISWKFYNISTTFYNFLQHCWNILMKYWYIDILYVSKAFLQYYIANCIVAMFLKCYCKLQCCMNKGSLVMASRKKKYHKWLLLSCYMYKFVRILARLFWRLSRKQRLGKREFIVSASYTYCRVVATF